MHLSLRHHGWARGLLVALSAGACQAVDHRMGSAQDGEDPGAGGNGAGGDVIFGSFTSESTSDSGGSGAGGSEAGGSEAGGAEAANDSGTSGGGASSMASISGADSTGGSAGDGASDEPLVPDSCTDELAVYEDIWCQYSAICGQEVVTIRCDGAADVFDCDCGLLDDPSRSFELAGVSSADACSHMIPLCLNSPQVDAGAFECTPSYEHDGPGLCILDGDCTREGVIGAAHFVESYLRQSDCGETESGWTCGCGNPDDGSFEISGSSNDPQCLDAFDWCGGQEVQPGGSRTCTPTGQTTLDDYCYADLQCETPVMLSGREGTLVEVDRLYCQFASGEFYSCSCTDNGEPEVTVLSDPLTACSQAVAACNER